MALGIFKDGIVLASQCMENKKKKKKGVKVTNTDARENDWFDKEYRDRRKETHSKLRNFRRTHNRQHKQVYTESRKVNISHGLNRKRKNTSKTNQKYLQKK